MDFNMPFLSKWTVNRYKTYKTHEWGDRKLGDVVLVVLSGYDGSAV